MFAPEVTYWTRAYHTYTHPPEVSIIFGVALHFLMGNGGSIITARDAEKFAGAMWSQEKYDQLKGPDGLVHLPLNPEQFKISTVQGVVVGRYGTTTAAAEISQFVHTRLHFFTAFTKISPFFLFH